MNRSDHESTLCRCSIVWISSHGEWVPSLRLEATAPASGELRLSQFCTCSFVTIHAEVLQHQFFLYRTFTNGDGHTRNVPRKHQRWLLVAVSPLLEWCAAVPLGTAVLELELSLNRIPKCIKKAFGTRKTKNSKVCNSAACQKDLLLHSSAAHIASMLDMLASIRG